MKLITISGLDGSGKSTQIKLLQSYLESQGKKVFYFHAIQFSLANILKNQYYKLLRTPKNIVSNETSSVGVTKANWLQIILRRIFLMIDLLRFKLLRNKLRNKNYDHILSDRYFYDSVINIYYLSKNKKALPCEKFIPRPDLAIYLEMNPENIMQRERKPDQGLEYLKRKESLYSNISNKWNLMTIDGNRLPEEIFSNLRELL